MLEEYINGEFKEIMLKAERAEVIKVGLFLNIPLQEMLTVKFPGAGGQRPPPSRRCVAKRGSLAWILASGVR